MSSPGLSSVPAKREPIITASAPAAIALLMSPEYLMPPSAMTGMPKRAAASAQSMMAVIWGTPAPETTRVVQIEPGPMPTLTASAPASARSATASAVATFPAMSGTVGNLALKRRTASSTPVECPWAVSMATMSTPADTRASARSRLSLETPMAAPTTRRPWRSLQALG